MVVFRFRIWYVGICVWELKRFLKRILVDLFREIVMVRIMNFSFYNNFGKLKKRELYLIEFIYYFKNFIDEILI